MSKTILTVDDSPSIRNMISMTLREAGYTVLEAGDGKEGLGTAISTRVDAIITDQNMPNMDGITMIKQLREHPCGRGVPIVVLSTDSADTLKQEARAAGALGWMVKPFTQEKLLAVVKKVLG